MKFCLLDKTSAQPAVALAMRVLSLPEQGTRLAAKQAEVMYQKGLVRQLEEKLLKMDNTYKDLQSDLTNGVELWRTKYDKLQAKLIQFTTLIRHKAAAARLRARQTTQTTTTIDPPTPAPACAISVTTTNAHGLNRSSAGQLPDLNRLCGSDATVVAPNHQGSSSGQWGSNNVPGEVEKNRGSTFWPQASCGEANWHATSSKATNEPNYHVMQPVNLGIDYTTREVGHQLGQHHNYGTQVQPQPQQLALTYHGQQHHVPIGGQRLPPWKQPQPQYGWTQGSAPHPNMGPQVGTHVNNYTGAEHHQQYTNADVNVDWTTQHHWRNALTKM